MDDQYCAVILGLGSLRFRQFVEFLFLRFVECSVVLVGCSVSSLVDSSESPETGADVGKGWVSGSGSATSATPLGAASGSGAESCSAPDSSSGSSISLSVTIADSVSAGATGAVVWADGSGVGSGSQNF